jgi:hypothetical protein
VAQPLPDTPSALRPTKAVCVLVAAILEGPELANKYTSANPRRANARLSILAIINGLSSKIKTAARS